MNEFGTHGSHVLLAAAGKGNDMSPSQTDLMRVIGVQLPPAVTLDTTGFGKDAFILNALDYIYLCAEEIAEAYCGDRNAPLPWSSISATATRAAPMTAAARWSVTCASASRRVS